MHKTALCTQGSLVHCTCVLLAGVLSLLAPIYFTQAAALLRVSDTISNSIPGQGSDHDISFTLSNAVGASGVVRLVFQGDFFQIPDDFDYRSVDFIVNGVQKALGAVPGAGAGSAIGVLIATSTGTFSFTLNNSDALLAGDVVRVVLGGAAVYGSSGIRNITNPSSQRSYLIDIETRSSGGALIDSSAAMIATIDSVTVSSYQPIDPRRRIGAPGPGSVSVPPITTTPTSQTQTETTQAVVTTETQLVLSETQELKLAEQTLTKAETIPVKIVEIVKVNEPVKIVVQAPMIVTEELALQVAGEAPQVVKRKESLQLTIELPPDFIAGTQAATTQAVTVSVNSVSTAAVQNIAEPPRGTNIVEGAVFSIILKGEGGGEVSGKTTKSSKLTFQILRSDESGSYIRELAKPMTLTFQYTDAQVKDFEEGTLKVHYLDINKKEWVPIDTSKVNPDTNSITAVVDHLTIFTLIGKPLKPFSVVIPKIKKQPKKAEGEEKIPPAGVLENSDGSQEEIEIPEKYSFIFDFIASVILAGVLLKLMQRLKKKNRLL